jgi:hypothetical protein
MNTEIPKMPRWQYFDLMGNNCRLRGMSHDEAQEVINAVSRYPGDGYNFWHGFLYGREEIIQELPLQSELWD